MMIPAEITIFEDRSFTFVTKTPPTPFLLVQAAGIEKGAAARAREKAGTVTEAQVARSPRRRCPTSTPIDLDGAMARWPAPRARWASRSSTSEPSRRGGPRRGSRSPRELEGASHGHGKKYSTRPAVRPRAAPRAGRGVRPREVAGEAQVRRDRRDRVAPRRRSPQGRPDDPRHRLAAEGTGKAVRVAVFAAGDAAARRRRPVPTSWAPTTSSPGSRRASSTSTSPSPRPT